MSASKAVKTHEKSAASATSEPAPPRKPRQQDVTLIYRKGKFVPPPDIQVIKGDTLNFKCDTDLPDATMSIRIKRKKFFEPAKFTNGGPLVKVIMPLNKGRRYGYVCQFDGTLDGKPYGYEGPAGGFIIP